MKKENRPDPGQLQKRGNILTLVLCLLYLSGVIFIRIHYSVFHYNEFIFISLALASGLFLLNHPGTVRISKTVSYVLNLILIVVFVVLVGTPHGMNALEYCTKIFGAAAVLCVWKMFLSVVSSAAEDASRS